MCKIHSYIELQWAMAVSHVGDLRGKCIVHHVLLIRLQRYLTNHCWRQNAWLETFWCKAAGDIDSLAQTHYALLLPWQLKSCCPNLSFASVPRLQMVRNDTIASVPAQESGVGGLCFVNVRNSRTGNRVPTTTASFLFSCYKEMWPLT